MSDTHNEVTYLTSMRDLPEMKLLLAAITLAEELNFTKAAIRLGISQSGLSRQINTLEGRLKLRLFTRDRLHVKLSETGTAFVREARLSLHYAEKAVRAAEKASNEGQTLHIGRSPYASPWLTSALLSIRLQRYPKLRVKLESQFAAELTVQLMACKLDMALIANPPRLRGLTSVRVDRTDLCAVLPIRHRLAKRSALHLRDLGRLTWIVFDRKAHAGLHDSILGHATKEKIPVPEIQAVLSVDEALQLVQQDRGVAFIARSGIEDRLPQALVAVPLADEGFVIETHLVSRTDDESPLVSAFVRSYVSRVCKKAD